MNLSPFAKGFIIVLILTLLVGGLVFVNRIFFGDAFTGEEASHALFGMWIWRDLKTADWSSFWYDTGRQMVWPFLHSWLLALFFLVFGIGYVPARLLSLVMFIASVLMLYVLAHKFCKKDGWKIGALAGVLMLTSPLLLNFASENMIESLGAFLFLAATFLYLVSEEKRLLIYYIGLAVIVGLSLYTNYIYAFFMLPAFLVVTLVKLGPLSLEAMKLSRLGEKAAVPFIWWGYKKLIVLGILLILAGVWFSFNFSRRFMLFFDSILRSGRGQELGLLGSLIYYPRVIIEKLSFSPWLGVLFLAALLLPMAARRYQGLNKLFIFVWTVLLLATLIITAKSAQMIYIITPFIILIFSAVFFYLLEEFKQRDKKLAVLLVLAVLLPALISAPKVLNLYFQPRTSHDLIDVLDYFQAAVPAKAMVATIINIKRFNPKVVRFHFRDWDDRVLGENELNEGLGRAREIYYLTFALDQDSPYQKDVVNDSIYRWNSWLKQGEISGQIRLASVRRFPDIGLTASVYRKTSR